jgi:hypothetical protein
MDSGLIKDGMGLAGSVIMAVPFFRDQMTRKQRKQIAALKDFFTPFAKALSRAEAEETDNLQAPSRFDTGCMLTGLMLLGASFAVGLFAGLGFL